MRPRTVVSGPRGRRLLAGAAAVVLGLGGCSQGEEPLPDDLRSGSAESLPPVDPALQRFHDQELDWERCEGGECASLQVPVDHAHPEGDTMQLALFRSRARDTEHRIGSLVLNPGGPGSSGVDMARNADAFVGSKVRRVYDVVGFDPRGVARSDGVDCVDDAGLDAYLGADTTPDDAAERREGQRALGDFTTGCEQRVGARLEHITTEAAARDMDILRGALGDDHLNYLGFSYGTMLGATYAERFPRRVGAFVLDGMLPTDLDNREVALGQARGFETATNAYLDWCVEQGDCPLGDSREGARQGLRELLARVDEDPLPVDGDARVQELTQGWASYGIAAGLYSQEDWESLTEALSDAVDGDGTYLMEFANYYTDRSSEGKYASNMLEAFTVYTCNDRPDGFAGRSLPEARREFREAAPLWGDFLLGEGSACGDWPVTPDEPLEADARGSGPILVVGTTRDPATPLAWARRAVEDLDDGHLLTLDGDGHTAYGRGNACIDEAVDDYLLTGAVPEGEAARCD